MFRAEYGQVEYLTDQMMADILGLESRVTPVGCCSFFFNYHSHSITKNIQLLFILLYVYWLFRAVLNEDKFASNFPICPKS